MLCFKNWKSYQYQISKFVEYQPENNRKENYIFQTFLYIQKKNNNKKRVHIIFSSYLFYTYMYKTIYLSIAHACFLYHIFFFVHFYSVFCFILQNIYTDHVYIHGFIYQFLFLFSVTKKKKIKKKNL